MDMVWLPPVLSLRIYTVVCTCCTGNQGWKTSWYFRTYIEKNQIFSIFLIFLMYIEHLHIRGSDCIYCCAFTVTVGELIVGPFWSCGLRLFCYYPSSSIFIKTFIYAMHCKVQFDLSNVNYFLIIRHVFPQDNLAIDHFYVSVCLQCIE